MNGLDRLKLFSAIRDADLGKNDRLVLYTIATRLNVEGIAWPGVESIARVSGLSERACRHAIADLEARGVLLVTRGGGARNTNVYAVAEATLVPREDRRSTRADRKRVHPVQGSEKGASDAGFPSGDTHARQPGTACTPTLHPVQGYPGIACSDNPAPRAPEQIQANGFREERKERGQDLASGKCEGDDVWSASRLLDAARVLSGRSKREAAKRRELLDDPLCVRVLRQCGYAEIVDRALRDEQDESLREQVSSPRLLRAVAGGGR